jgi:hypothetical protein
MSTNLTQAERGAVDELILEAQKLAVISDNFAETIAPRGAEQHAQALQQQASVVRSIVERLPQPLSAWDGTLKDEHLEIEKFAPNARPGELIGVTVKHTITGIGRTSESKPTYEDNLRVARAALETAVAERFQKTHQ